MSRARDCFICGMALADGERLVLMRGRVHEDHCSEVCVLTNVHRRRRASAAVRRRWLLRLLLVVAVAEGGSVLWQRYRMPQPQSISLAAPEPPRQWAPMRAGPVEYGPPWPPTDDDWLSIFRQTSWIYPLPGPLRRPPTIDGRLFDLEKHGMRPAFCRTDARCTVALGGELWGEHVYAVQDGVVERVRRTGSDERGGEYVRLSHFGGYVFTQYAHLAGIPRSIVPGVRVKAGDVIGLLGDTGSERPVRKLYFALSIRIARELSESYWDPTPLMATWPLRRPVHGSVAGFAPDREPATPPRRRLQ